MYSYISSMNACFFKKKHEKLNLKIMNNPDEVKMKDDDQKANIFPIIPILTAAASIGSAIWNNREQRKQQERLNRDQIKGQKELGRFNQELAMETFEKTGYEARRRQMEAAGLNVGLMYNGQGQGGTTAGGQAGNVTGGQANPNSIGMGLQLGLQAALQKAQIENIKANTEKQKVEANKIGGVDTEATQTAIQSTLQGITNAKTQNQLMEIQEEYNKLQLNTANKTQEEIIAQAEQLTQKLKGEAESAKAKGEIDQATVDTLIQQATAQLNQTRTQTTATQAGTEATRAGTAQTQQQTRNLQQDEIQKMLENKMRESGIQPADNAIFRKVLETLNEMGAKPADVGRKMKIIMLWLKGQAGEQTTAHLKELLQE